MDTLTADKKDKAKLGLEVDALRMLALTSNQINQKRRESVGASLAYPYKRICSSNNVVTENLFGDEVPKLIKDIADAQTVGHKVTGYQRNPTLTRRKENTRDTATTLIRTTKAGTDRAPKPPEAHRHCRKGHQSCDWPTPVPLHQQRQYLVQ